MPGERSPEERSRLEGWTLPPEAVLRGCRNQSRRGGKGNTRCSRQEKAWRRETKNVVPTEAKKRVVPSDKNTKYRDE